MVTSSSQRDEQQLSSPLEPFFTLKEIQSLDRMIQAHQKVISDHEARISKLKNIRITKAQDLTDATAELQRLNQTYSSEEKNNQLLTRDLTQAQANTMASTNDHELKAANTQIATKKPLKEKSDQVLYELLTAIDEKEQEIIDLKNFLEGSAKTLADIELEVATDLKKEKADIENLEMRINLLSDSLPANFKSKFQSVNKKHRFKSPVTIITNNHCGECYMVVSKMQISQVDRAATLELCSQCERIFLPSGAC